MKNLLELTFIALLGYGWNSWLNKFVSLPLGGGNYIDAVIVALFTTCKRPSCLSGNLARIAG